MTETVILKGKTVSFELTCKKVKNINLRIKTDGTVCVSANASVPVSRIKAFMEANADAILRALEKGERRKEKPVIAYTDEAGIRKITEAICQREYPYFKTRGVTYPKIRFRRMTSCWGNCRPKQGVLTFNTNLMFAPQECVRYVVLHEFTHFLQQNHSRAFYDELAKVCPAWKTLRKQLKGISVR